MMVRAGPLLPVSVLGGTVVLIVLVTVTLRWRERRREANRRRAGLPPSWPAALPAVYARWAEPKKRLARAEYFGRLHYDANGELRWEAARWSARNAPAVSWDATWSRTIELAGGRTQRGRLTLTAPDGTAMDVYLRDYRDLARVLGVSITGLGILPD